jgi:hypothetical protein
VVDARPERKETRTARRGGRKQKDAGTLEIPMDPEALRRAYEAAVRWGDDPDVDEDPERLAELDDLLAQLSPVGREAIDFELARQDLADPPPIGSTQAGRHRRAVRRICILILQRPGLTAYHALAERRLAELEKHTPRKRPN